MGKSGKNISQNPQLNHLRSLVHTSAHEVQEDPQRVKKDSRWDSRLMLACPGRPGPRRCEWRCALEGGTISSKAFGI